MQWVDDIYDLTVTAYGGTKPQNITCLQYQNGGVTYLLHIEPPTLKKRNIRLPTRNFFTNTLQISHLKDSFQFLHGLMKSEINNINIREVISNILKYIIDRVLELAFQVRASGIGWSTTEYYKNLPLAQRIWLDDSYIKEREKYRRMVGCYLWAFARLGYSSLRKNIKKRTY